jgi:hypothetical protein
LCGKKPKEKTNGEKTTEKRSSHQNFVLCCAAAAVVCGWFRRALFAPAVFFVGD